jgi:hypothetical protein
MRDLPTTQAGPHVENVLAQLHELVLHLRRDIDKITEPKARALFETSAEVLDGLERAFLNYQQPAEQPHRK